MKKFITTLQQNVGTFTTGFIATLSFFIFWELFEVPWMFSLGVLLVLFAVFVSKKVDHHYHGHHQHQGDSLTDYIAPSVLLLANILHPAVDGFSFYQTLAFNGTVAAVVVGFGVVLHEIVRQSALSAAFRPMGIRWYTVAATALLGVIFGIGLGYAESSFIQRYEYIADFATIFAYAFVITEYYLHGDHSKNQKFAGWGIGGILLAIGLRMLLTF